MKYTTCFASGILIGIFITSIAMTIFFANVSVDERTLINNGHAYYHPQTGNFTLKECKE